jgi:uncharacterized membrane protein YcaP (DUF421 family)
MFTMTIHPIELFIRVVVVYAFLFTLIRLVGKKHVGEMAPFDLVVLLVVSECVQNALIGEDRSVTAGIVAAASLFGMSQLVGFVCWRNKKAARFLEGVPRVLVRNGAVNDEVLAQEQVTRAELLEALRREGCTSFGTVRYAVLENDGVITIGRRADLRRARPESLLKEKQQS